MIKKEFVIEFENKGIDVASKELDIMNPDKRLEVLSNILSGYVQDTYKKNKFFRKVLDRNNVNPLSIKTVEDFRKIPLLGLETIESIHPEQLLPDEYYSNILTGFAHFDDHKKIGQWYSSSGSTGKPKEVFYTRLDWDNTMAVIARGFQHIPLQEMNKPLICFHMGHVGGPVFHDAINRMGGLVKKKIFSYNEPEQVIDQIKKGFSHHAGFNCLAVPPQTPPGALVKKGVTFADLLDVDKENIIGKQVKVVITTGAPRSKELLERTWELNELANVDFKTKFIDWAGCAEVLPTVAECQENDGMHTLPGITFVEVINEKTGEHVKNNERGLLVYTGLKYGSRFIRYVVGDEATYIKTKCKCGRTTPRIKDIQRVKDKGRLQGGCAAGY